MSGDGIHGVDGGRGISVAGYSVSLAVLPTATAEVRGQTKVRVHLTQHPPHDTISCRGQRSVCKVVKSHTVRF